MNWFTYPVVLSLHRTVIRLLHLSSGASMTVEDFLEQKELEFTDVSGLDLASGVLTDRTYEGCKFEGINFQNVDFSRARFVDCKFLNCDLSNVRFNRASLRDCAFQGCKLIGINWSLISDFSLISFSSCELRYGNFNGLKMKKSSIDHCSARDCDFTDLDLTGSHLKYCDFQGAIFSKTNLSKCDFTESVNINVNPKDNILTGSTFPMNEGLAILSLMGIKIV